MVAEQPTAAPQSGILNRAQLMELIMSLNPTATPAFLGQFQDAMLRGYLDHLTAVQEPRGSSARWLRPADSPAIVGRDAGE